MHGSGVVDSLGILVGCATSSIQLGYGYGSELGHGVGLVLLSVAEKHLLV